MYFKRSVCCVLVLFSLLKIQGQDSYKVFKIPSPQPYVTKPFIYQDSQIDSLIRWQERLLLHIDKPAVEEGMPLFFKAYAFTGPNRMPATLSKVMKMELLDDMDNIVAVQYHRIEGGASQGEFVIPNKLNKGRYRLRAYTRWMQNYGSSFYYSKELFLDDAAKKEVKSKQLQKVTVDFYPEGGSLIANIKNRLLLKAKATNGALVGLPGTIINSTGDKVASVTVFDNDIMSVIFKPKEGEQYSFVPFDENQNTFLLPLPNKEGYGITVSNLDENDLGVAIITSNSNSKREVWLKGEMGGVTYFDKKLNFKTPTTILEIPKKGIPFGILTLYIVDDNNNVWSKRPVYIRPINDIKASVTQNLNESTKEDLVFTVKLTDGQGLPVIGDFSFSATNLVSDKGSYTDKALGFAWEEGQKERDNKNRLRLQTFVEDLKLLTTDSPNKFQEIPKQIFYPFQNGLDLFGYAYDLNNKLLKNKKLQVLSTSDTAVLIKEIATDEQGRFGLEQLQLDGQTTLVFRTEGDDTASRIVKIAPFQEVGKETKRLTPSTNLKNKVVQASPWLPGTEKDLVVLDEVELVEKQKENEESKEGNYGIVPTNLVVPDVERPVTLPEMLLGIPGVQIANLGGLNPIVSIPRLSAGGPILWIIDGIAIHQTDTTFQTIMDRVTAGDVKDIELYLGAEAAVYGSRGSGGVIAINTRSGSELGQVKRKEGSFYFQGYHQGLGFEPYAKKVATRARKYKNKPVTLFWSPSISTDANGEAIVRFSSPIPYERLEIKLSTVTRTGKIASVKRIF